MTTLHLVRATLGLAALLLAAPAAQALSCTSTINFADGGADATDCAGQTVDIGFASGGRLTLRNVMSELWPQSSPISGMIISFNEDIDSFPGLAHEFRVRPLTSNQSWDQDLSVLDDMATFTASDASENLFLNDAYIWIVTVALHRRSHGARPHRNGGVETAHLRRQGHCPTSVHRSTPGLD
jgi:hypothetical protein